MNTQDRSRQVDTTLFNRYWTLCLLDGLSRNGLAPNSRREIFSFAYLACAVASEFRVQSIQNAVLKNESGPKMLVVSRALDRLIAGGLVDVYDISGSLLNPAKVIEGQYLVSTRGQAAIERSVNSSKYLEPTAKFLYEVSYAFGNLNPEEISIATQHDASFADLSVASGDVVDLGEWEPGNKTTEMLKFLREYTRSIFQKDPLVACQMYARYLDKKADSKSDVEAAASGVVA